jgi:hypothetical protein
VSTLTLTERTDDLHIKDRSLPLPRVHSRQKEFASVHLRQPPASLSTPFRNTPDQPGALRQRAPASRSSETRLLTQSSRQSRSSRVIDVAELIWEPIAI